MSHYSGAFVPDTRDIQFATDACKWKKWSGDAVTRRGGKSRVFAASSAFHVFVRCTRSNNHTATGPKMKIGIQVISAGQRSAHWSPAGGVPASW